jgi:hypothetical protein
MNSVTLSLSPSLSLIKQLPKNARRLWSAHRTIGCGAPPILDRSFDKLYEYHAVHLLSPENQRKLGVLQFT